MDRCRPPDGASVEEIADGAWRLTACAPPGHPALEILGCLVDPPTGAEGTAEYGPLERHAAVRFLLSEATQRLLTAAGVILRTLSRGPHEDPGDTGSHVDADGCVHAGLVDWSATLIRRMASGGQRTAVVMRRPEVQRDLPKNRVLRFLLLETEHRAKALAHAPALDAPVRARMLRLASRTAKLAHHPLLETVPPEPSRAGLRDASRSPLADDRMVARAYELYDAIWGSGSREVLLDTTREALRSSIPAPSVEASLAFVRAVNAARSRAPDAVVSVRPLPARRGLVAACHSQERTIEVTMSKATVPSVVVRTVTDGVAREEHLPVGSP